MKNLFFFLVIGVLLASCARNPISGKKEFAISEKKELQLGASYDPQIIASMGEYKDPQLEALINKLGMEMAKESHRPNLEWKFTIIDSDVVNAFAVPGGYVYFTRGILAHFNNEAEFAGVLGHEIGHVTARHTAKSMRRQQLAQVGMIAGMLASQEVRNNMEAISQGMQLLFLKYGRDAESQSDALGVEYSSLQGYDANYMAGFFKTIDRLQKKAGVEIPDFMSTHPNPLNREANVKQMASEWQKKLPGAQDKVNRESYLKLIDGIVYGEDPNQGYEENGVFYHPSLKFKFDIPKGWKLANSPQQVQIASPNNDGAVMFSLAQGTDAAEAAQSWVQQNELTAGQKGATTVNGMQAYQVSGSQGGQAQQGQQAQPEILWQATFISYNGQVYNFTEVAQAAAVKSIGQTLEIPFRSFNKLTEAKYLNRKAERLKIERVNSKMTLQAFLKQAGIPTSRNLEFAILNGMELKQQLSPGTMIKTISNIRP
ncbi:MAG: M48 family metalloprotease [Saprospiraceae bacterium]